MSKDIVQTKVLFAYTVKVVDFVIAPLIFLTNFDVICEQYHRNALSIF